LKFFVRWCGLNGYEYLADIDGYAIENYGQWRRYEGHEADGSALAATTYKTSLKRLKHFLKWCERTEYVRPRLPEKVKIPRIEGGDTRERPEKLDPEEASAALEHAEKYYEAEPKHIVLLLTVRTGGRPGDLQELDRSDYERSGREGVLTIQHRPSPGTDNPQELPENAWLTSKPESTGLKNNEGGERHITLGQNICDVIDDYLEKYWEPPTEDSGRRPLLVTKNGSGRISTSSIRKYIYELTRPCKTINNCPAGIDPEDCPAVGNDKTVTECKENVPPKALKKGLISDLRDQGVDPEVVSGEVDATPQVIKEHNDKPDEEKRRQARDEELRGIDWYGFD
jgi:integrase